MICELCDLDLYYGPLCMLSENSNHRICLIRAQYSIVSATTKMLSSGKGAVKMFQSSFVSFIHTTSTSIIRNRH